MLPIPFPRATVHVYERQIPEIIKSFCLFVGEENLAERIETARKMLKGATPIYREFLVRPRQFVWLGTQEIISLLSQDRRPLQYMTPVAVAALHQLAAIRRVSHTMPHWKKHEFRCRLTDKKGGDIAALVEIESASRILALGGDVRWMPEGARGERTFEMVGSYRGQKFEVECKSKSVDAGRKLARDSIYQFADRLMINQTNLNSPRESRYISILVPGHFPRAQEAQELLVGSLEPLFLEGGTRLLQNGSMVSVENITAEELRRRATASQEEFEHRLVTRDLVVSFRSKKPDQMIDNIEFVLSDAIKQFSGKRPALIACYIPEVESFEGVEKQGTATSALVQRFLSRPDAANIVSLTFFSDPKIEVRFGEVETGLPAVRFVANRFRGSPIEIF